MHGGFAGYITALNGEDGTILWDDQIEPNGTINGEVIILDADKDGDLDIVTSSWNFAGPSNICCYEAATLNPLWCYQDDLGNMYHGPSFADIDQDEKMELAITTADGQLLVINAEDGSLHWERTYDIPFHNSIYATSIADFNDDGLYEIVFFDYGVVGVWSHDGQLLWSEDLGFTEVFRGASISDINNDDRLDLVFAGDDFLYALDGATGNEHWKLDLAAHDGRSLFSLDHGVLIADFNGDDLLDIFVTGGYGISDPTIENNFGRAYCITTNSTGGPEWTMFRRDSVRSGTLPIQDISTTTNRSDPIDISIFPNPVSDILFLASTETVEVDYVSILDMNGQEVMTSNSSKSIRVSSLPVSQYVIEVHTSRGVIRKSFSKVD